MNTLILLVIAGVIATLITPGIIAASTAAWGAFTAAVNLQALATSLFGFSMFRVLGRIGG